MCSYIFIIGERFESDGNGVKAVYVIISKQKNGANRIITGEGEYKLLQFCQGLQSSYNSVGGNNHQGRPQKAVMSIWL